MKLLQWRFDFNVKISSKTENIPSFIGVVANHRGHRVVLGGVMNDEKEERPLRRLTSVTLGWLAEKMRKAEALKEQIRSGTYKVDSEAVAASMANQKEEERE